MDRFREPMGALRISAGFGRVYHLLCSPGITPGSVVSAKLVKGNVGWCDFIRCPQFLASNRSSLYYAYVLLANAEKGILLILQM